MDIAGIIVVIRVLLSKMYEISPLFIYELYINPVKNVKAVIKPINAIFLFLLFISTIVKYLPAIQYIIGIE